ncbi:MAG: transcriptional repressor NrdR [Lachnospiraceae bacterium]|nr:transcriptional repressor NrdR [Lachnospiraceae bacterium]MBR1844493.1 transcriptional repressor NrdR [Lachnospiraceae bacterium]
MKCPFCGTEDTKVIDSRRNEDFSIRRRRECLKCKKRFTTYEKIETSPILVIKKDSTRQPFDREKIRKGILNSCVKRPISSKTIEKIVDEVEKEVLLKDKSEIQSIEIGEIVLKKLKKIDDVAYIRFASVYREFKEVENFNTEVAKIRPHTKKAK